ncbi:MAG: hypothetical protein GF329_12555 [Candidatus Lokiarchaeota archaeon]|nr:hypothetical protein [Candidatus Lokiarchaeota archaeon]
MSDENDIVYDVPKSKINWTDAEKITAKIITAGIMASLVVVIVGGIWTLFEIIFISIYPITSFFDFFLSLSNGVQIFLIFAGFLILIFFIIALILLVRRGYKFVLHFLFKIEE